MTRTKDFYLLLLSYAFVEIRSLQVEGDLSLAPKLADVFHNVPEALRLPWIEEREERIYEQLRAKAQAQGLLDLLGRWEARAFRRMGIEAEGQIVNETASPYSPRD
jgi:hypothetical protein